MNGTDSVSRLTVLGCGDAFGSGGRGQTSFFWQTGAGNILIDCGATALPALRAHGWDTDEVDVIVLSHFHGDHFGGLPFFILKAGIYGREKPLTIFSPPGCEDRLRAALTLFYPGNEDSLDKAAPTFIEFSGHQRVSGAGIVIESFPVIHSPASLPHGVRISAAGKTLAYSGDTAWTEELIPLAEDSDLFICECNFFTTRLKNHLTYADLTGHLSDLHTKRLLLTHFDDEMLRELDHIPEQCATDGMVMTF